LEERKGRIKAEIPVDGTAETLSRIVRKYVNKEAKMVCADGYHGYDRLQQEFKTERIDHQIEYVRGQVHTQGIENFWSILKRDIIGNYQKVSKKYLMLYLNEFTFRFNNRNNGNGFYEDVLRNATKID